MPNALPCTVLFSIGLIGESETENQLSADKFLITSILNVKTRWLPVNMK